MVQTLASKYTWHLLHSKYAPNLYYKTIVASELETIILILQEVMRLVILYNCTCSQLQLVDVAWVDKLQLLMCHIIYPCVMTSDCLD